MNRLKDIKFPEGNRPASRKASVFMFRLILGLNPHSLLDTRESTYNRAIISIPATGKAAIQTLKPRIIQTPDTKWQERGFINSCVFIYYFFFLIYHQEVLPRSLFVPALKILCLRSPCAGGGEAAGLSAS